MKDIAKAAALIRSGGLVAFPTETVYGLGANALDANAVRKIFKIKGRPADNPLIVHIADRKMLESLVTEIPPVAEKLMQRFWPGPLTILFRKKPIVPDVTTAGLPSVGVRMPDNEIALSLIKESGVPIAAPSANKSGRPSPTTAAHVREDFPDLFVIDGGQTRSGLESTFVAVDGKPRVLRLGAITLEQLREVIPDIELKTGLLAEKPESPGQKYKHYAPKVPLLLFHDADDLLRYAKEHANAKILAKRKDLKNFEELGNQLIDIGDSDEDVARNLYAELRRHESDELLVLAIEKKGIGRAVMDRLERAATKIF